jgi:hypothetical protein
VHPQPTTTTVLPKIVAAIIVGRWGITSMSAPNPSQTNKVKAQVSIRGTKARNPWCKSNRANYPWEGSGFRRSGEGAGLLGFIVSQRGIDPNPKKVSALDWMGPIQDLKGVKKVLGCLAALSRFISRLGEKGLPLY